MINQIISDTWKSILVSEILSLMYDEIKKSLKYDNRKLLSKKDEFNESFRLILTDSLNWAGYVQSIGLYGSTNDLVSHYIDLDYYIYPKRLQHKPLVPSENLSEKISEDNEKNLLLFGLPGMGKTTSMKMIVYKIITEPNFLKNYLPIPFVVRFREFKNIFKLEDFKNNSNNLLFIYLFNLLNLKIDVDDRKIDEICNTQISYFDLIRRITLSALENLKVVLILDGFDELESSIRDNIISQIRELSFKTNNCKILITSRTGEFNYNIENYHYYELAPLKINQVKLFSQKWLGIKHLEFISKLETSSFYDTAMRPLILTFLCLIYKHNGELPSKPKFIYKEIIDLLLERWNKENNNFKKSNFTNFNKNQKLEFISDLAFQLTIESKYYFSKHDLQIAYVEISENYELEKQNYQEVIDEIEEHSGIFIQSGVDSYEFPHKSIQEFLTSEYLVKCSSISKFHEKFHIIPNELAIVISLSRNPNDTLIEILNKVSFISIDNIVSFFNVFTKRLNSEKVNFKIDVDTAIEICRVIEDFLKNDIVNSFDFFYDIYRLKGIQESFELMNNFFYCEPSIIKGLMDGNKFNGNDLVIITENKSTKKTKIYLKFITNWPYIRPYSKMII